MLKELRLIYRCVMAPSVIDLVYIRWSAMRDHAAAYEQASNFHIILIPMAFVIDRTASKRVIRSTVFATDLEAGVCSDYEATSGVSFRSHFVDTQS
jgi:hypothetical protein